MKTDAQSWLSSQGSRCRVCQDPKVKEAVQQWLDTRDEHGVSLLRFYNEFLAGELRFTWSYSVVRRHVLECLGQEGLR